MLVGQPEAVRAVLRDAARRAIYVPGKPADRVAVLHDPRCQNRTSIRRVYRYVDRTDSRSPALNGGSRQSGGVDQTALRRREHR